MSKKFFVVAALMMSLLAASAITYAAGAVASLSMTGGSLIQCVDNVIEGTVSVAAYDSAGAKITSFSGAQSFISSDGSTDSKLGTFISDSSARFYMGTGAGTISYVDITVSANGVTSNTIRIGCDGSVSVYGVNGEDDRMNYANGDLINVLYASTDSVKVYSVATDSTGVYEGRFAYALFEQYLNNPPAVNTFLGKIDQSSLYALTSGEFQIVIADPVESKSYTTIFSAFPISGVYFR